MILSRENRALADRLDDRLDLVAGLRVENFAAAANLQMSVPLEAYLDWRAKREAKTGIHLSITHGVVRSVLLALEKDPLMGALFDGRDRLELPRRLVVGVNVDTRDRARTAVVKNAACMDLEQLAQEISRQASNLRVQSGPVFGKGSLATVSSWRTRQRWAKMVILELRERLDYLWPLLQKRRFEQHLRQHGNIEIHNLGPNRVQAFKGFLRRPAVSGLWILAAADRVIRAEHGGFSKERRLPLVLAYAQELISLDRASAFLHGVCDRLRHPERLLEQGP